MNVVCFSKLKKNGASEDAPSGLLRFISSCVQAALEANGIFIFAAAHFAQVGPGSLVVRDDIAINSIGGDITLHTIEVSKLHEHLIALHAWYKICHRIC